MVLVRQQQFRTRTDRARKQGIVDAGRRTKPGQENHRPHRRHGVFGLLHDSSRDTPGADTHFEGERAIAAFVAAGGANYLGARVPVENDPNGGTMDDHWRESVFGTELMS